MTSFSGARAGQVALVLTKHKWSVEISNQISVSQEFLILCYARGRSLTDGVLHQPAAGASYFTPALAAFSIAYRNRINGLLTMFRRSETMKCVAKI